MELKSPYRKIRFGRCTLDEGRGVLLSADGVESVLRPKTLELLRLLLDNPGRVVARGEILDAVWPGVFVTDDSITQCVVEIRKAMGAGGTEVLKTIPRRGYLLQAEVSAEAPAVQPVPTLLSPRVPEGPSIAVLPFRNDHHDPQEAYFADGIIEGIVHVLSGLDGLFVVSRSSALAFAQITTDARAAGRELGVRYVLYGGVRRAGGRLRITTELVDAQRGIILRADRHDGADADLFELQDRIAEEVAATIAPQLREHELAAALRKPPATLTAYDLVLRALDQAKRTEPEAMTRAEALLGEALKTEPAYATALSYLALLRMIRVSEGWAVDPAATVGEAAHYAEAAVEANPADPLALAVRGHTVSYLTRDYAAAMRLLERAMRIGPSCAWAWAWGSATAGYLGETEHAVRLAERAVRLAPLDPFAYLFEHLLSQAHYLHGALEPAVHWARRSMAANPRHAPNLRVLAASLVGLGRGAEAKEAARRLQEVDAGFRVSAFAARTPLPPAVRGAFCDRLLAAGLPA
jgi:TolB-like protein